MLQVPLGQPGTLKKIICWEFEGTAYDQGDEAASWFTNYLGSPHRLVRYAGNLWFLLHGSQDDLVRYSKLMLAALTDLW